MTDPIHPQDAPRNRLARDLGIALSFCTLVGLIFGAGRLYPVSSASGSATGAGPQVVIENAPGTTATATATGQPLGQRQGGAARAADDSEPPPAAPQPPPTAPQPPPTAPQPPEVAQPPAPPARALETALHTRSSRGGARMR